MQLLHNCDIQAKNHNNFGYLGTSAKKVGRRTKSVHFVTKNLEIYELSFRINLMTN